MLSGCTFTVVGRGCAKAVVAIKNALSAVMNRTMSGVSVSNRGAMGLALQVLGLTRFFTLVSDNATDKLSRDRERIPTVAVVAGFRYPAAP